MASTLISVAEARERVLAAVSPLPVEEVPLDRALGRVLAEDVAASGDLPSFDSSAMDGFAVVAGGEAELRVVGESRAGTPFAGALRPGTAVRISTGAVIPRGADAVVPVERARERDGRVAVPAVAPGENVRRAGEDVRAGELLVRAGAPLGPPELAVLAAAGRATVRCGARPRVAVLVTGDELVAPGEPLGPGQIRDSNAVALAALAQAAGANVVRRERVRDRPADTRRALERGLDAADVVCVSGGVSVGPHDHVRPALAELGARELFWGVRLKPGKPVWFGAAGRTLVFGLPGNPVSAMVTFHLLARPALRALAGADPADRRTTARLDSSVRRNPARDQAIRCRLELRDDGWHVRPTKAQESHILSSMLDAQALALVPAGEGELAAGERVEIQLVG
ncbi:MAG: molybdopterin molybdotransferase MoeA [Thermoleophilaceae bacterium]|nr:molybdopterin molybdotransferase MoeA [Thermoleophilaceae bacterium]